MKKKIFGFLTVAAAVVFGTIATLNLQSKENVQAATTETTYSQGSVVAKGKTRVWFGYDKANAFYQYSDDMKLWVHSTKTGGSEKVYSLASVGGTFYNTQETGDNSSDTNFDKEDGGGTAHKTHRRYDYFDIDTSCFTSGWYITLQKFEGSSWKGQTSNTDPIKLSASNAAKVFYVWGDWGWDATQGTISVGTVEKIDAGFTAKALAGIQSCSDSNINGYNVFPNFQETFVLNEKKEWKTVGELGSYTISDFNNGDTALTGSRNNTVNAWDKYSFIENMYNSNQPVSLKNFITDNNQTSLVGITVISLGTIVAFVFFHKRRKINKI